MRHPTSILLRSVVSVMLLGATATAEETQIVTPALNVRVSSRQVALNQPVRVEFVTSPRELPNIDIPQVVTDAISITAHDTWRLIGKPVVVEHDRIHTVEITFTVLPRMSGSVALPQIPETWMRNNQIAGLGLVQVAEKIQVGNDQLDLPNFCTGVAGYAWGTKLSEVKTVRIADNLIETKGDAAIARPQSGLELEFRNNELVAATIQAPGLSLDQARQSFFSHWGQPQIEEAAQVTWIVGWTRIMASEGIGGPGNIQLTVTREDIQDHLNQAKVKDAVFDLLDGPAPSRQALDDAATKQRQRQEAEDFLKEQQAKDAQTVKDNAPPATPVTPSDAAPQVVPPPER
jgi:hypothetical protein